MWDSIPLLAKLAVIAFVVTNMLTMGLSLSVGQIHDTLKSWRLVLSVLVINFIAIPLLAFLIVNWSPSNPLWLWPCCCLVRQAGRPYCRSWWNLPKAISPLP